MKKNFFIGVSLGVILALFYEFVFYKDDTMYFDKSKIDYSKWNNLYLTVYDDTVSLTTFFGHYLFFVNDSGELTGFRHFSKVADTLHYFCTVENEYLFKMINDSLSCSVLEVE